MCFNVTICTLFVLFNINLSTKINFNRLKSKNSMNSLYRHYNNIITALVLLYNLSIIIIFFNQKFTMTIKCEIHITNTIKFNHKSTTE